MISSRPVGYGWRRPEYLGVREVSWALAGLGNPVPGARRLACDQLARWGLSAYSDVAELLVSELVTDALTHACGAKRLRIRLRSERVRFDVEDAFPAMPQVRSGCGDEEHGRGVLLVEVLAAC